MPYLRDEPLDYSLDEDKKQKKCKEVIYPEGGKPGMVLRDKEEKKCKCPLDTHIVQLKTIREPPLSENLTQPEKVVEFVKEMRDYDREQFKILHLDTKNRVIGVETVAIGCLNAIYMHPRESLKGAILNNASSVILIHNHPSGICDPSTEDKNVLESIEKAFDIVGINVVDNLIIGKDCYYSKKSGSSCPIKEE